MSPLLCRVWQSRDDEPKSAEQPDCSVKQIVFILYIRYTD
jgi:hypothetical protein